MIASVKSVGQKLKKLVQLSFLRYIIPLLNLQLWSNIGLYQGNQQTRGFLEFTDSIDLMKFAVLSWKCESRVKLSYTKFNKKCNSEPTKES